MSLRDLKWVYGLIDALSKKPDYKYDLGKRQNTKNNKNKANQIKNINYAIKTFIDWSKDRTSYKNLDNIKKQQQ